MSYMASSFEIWTEFMTVFKPACKFWPLLLRFWIPVDIYFLDTSKIVNNKLLLYYKINSVWKVKTFSGIWWIILQLLRTVRSNFQKNLPDSIPVSEVNVSLADTGHTRHSLTVIYFYFFQLENSLCLISYFLWSWDTVLCNSCFSPTKIPIVWIWTFNKTTKFKNSQNKVMNIHVQK